MDPRLLDLYLDELRYMQAMGGEFAAGHPDIARRLGMLGEETAGSSCEASARNVGLQNARLQQRFADDFPLLTQALLSSVYENYFAPRPSIAVARSYPGGEASGFMPGHTVKQGTEFTSALPETEKTLCVFHAMAAPRGHTKRELTPT